MKTLFFTAAAAALLCSCGKEPVCEHTPAPDTQGAAVTLSFDAGSSRTKSFFDPTAAAESWEKSLSSVCVLVFGADGRLLVQRNFTDSELSAKKATFAIPNALAGQNCDFYVVANKTVGGISGKTALMTLSETTPAEYNGTFAEVSAQAKRSGGFVMTGHTTKAIAAQGTKTDVAVTLERTVAKIAVQASTTAEFSERYSGKVRINSAVLSKAASRSNLIAQQTPNTGPMTFTHTQAADEPLRQVPEPVLRAGERRAGRREPPAADPRRDIRPRRQLLDDGRPSGSHLSRRAVRRRRGPVPSQRILPRTGPDRRAHRQRIIRLDLRGRLGSPRHAVGKPRAVAHSFGAGAVLCPLTFSFKLYRL